jgi:1-acyl-sn-glycerol-3-phosphate acyltransferase
VADRFTSRGHAAARFVAQRMILKPLVWSLTRVTVVGKEKLTGLDGAFIVVANHSSHLDAPLITGGLPRPLARYLAAGAAADYFFDVWWRKGLTALFFNAFPVDRSGSGKRAGLSRQLLERGVPLLVFPQGGRAKTEIIQGFKPGAASLSIAVDVPCLPIALVGAGRAMPRGVNWPKRGRQPVAIVFGSPLRATHGETAAEFSERLAQSVSSLYNEYSEKERS